VIVELFIHAMLAARDILPEQKLQGRLHAAGERGGHAGRKVPKLAEKSIAITRGRC